MLENTVFYLVEPKVILIEYGFCPLKVEIIFCVFVPWQFQQGLNVIKLYRIFASCRIKPVKLLYFFFESRFYRIAPFFLLPCSSKSLISCSMGFPPSSFWMVFICWCSMYSRCCWSMSNLTFDCISFFNSSSCTSFTRYSRRVIPYLSVDRLKVIFACLLVRYRCLN